MTRAASSTSRACSPLACSSCLDGIYITATIPSAETITWRRLTDPRPKSLLVFLIHVPPKHLKGFSAKVFHSRAWVGASVLTVCSVLDGHLPSNYALWMSFRINLEGWAPIKLEYVPTNIHYFQFQSSRIVTSSPSLNLSVFPIRLYPFTCDFTGAP